MRVVSFDLATGETTEQEVGTIPDVMTEAEARAKGLDEYAQAIRQERCRRLGLCDWTTKPDVPMTEARRIEWLAYRQALRDVPDQHGFPGAVDWPVPPG